MKDLELRRGSITMTVAGYVDEDGEIFCDFTDDYMCLSIEQAKKLRKHLKRLIASAE